MPIMTDSRSSKLHTNRATASSSGIGHGSELMASAATNTHWDTDVNFMTTTADLSEPPPDASAPTAARMQYLHAQLSSIGGKVVVLERFTLLGPNQRRQGGAQPRATQPVPTTPMHPKLIGSCST